MASLVVCCDCDMGLRRRGGITAVNVAHFLCKQAPGGGGASCAMDEQDECRWCSGRRWQILRVALESRVAVLQWQGLVKIVLHCVCP